MLAHVQIPCQFWVSLNTAFRTMPGKAIVKCLQHQCCSRALMPATCLIYKNHAPNMTVTMQVLELTIRFSGINKRFILKKTPSFQNHLLAALVPCTPKKINAAPQPAAALQLFPHTCAMVSLTRGGSRSNWSGTCPVERRQDSWKNLDGKVRPLEVP